MSKKALVIYYSLTGNSKFIAEAIKDAIDADILALKPVKELDPEKGSKFMWGGYQAIMKKTPELEPIEIDPLEYEVIFLGTPTWAWNFTPPIRSFIKKYDLSGKKVAIWSCSLGGTLKTITKLKRELKGAHILGDLSLKAPLNDEPEEANKKAIEWAKKLVDL